MWPQTTNKFGQNTVSVRTENLSECIRNKHQCVRNEIDRKTLYWIHSPLAAWQQQCLGQLSRRQKGERSRLSHLLDLPMTLIFCTVYRISHLFALQYCNYVGVCTDGERQVSLTQFLSFATGCDTEPPLGFMPQPSVVFLHAGQRPTDILYPTANTCGLVLSLPVTTTLWRLLWRYGQWYHSVTDFWFCMTGNQMYRVGQPPPPKKKTPFVLLCSNCESILFCIVVRTGYSCNYQYKKPVNSSILLWCHLCIKK